MGTARNTATILLGTPSKPTRSTTCLIGRWFLSLSRDQNLQHRTRNRISHLICEERGVAIIAKAVKNLLISSSLVSWLCSCPWYGRRSQGRN